MKEQIKKWLESPDRNFSDGIALLKNVEKNQKTIHAIEHNPNTFNKKQLIRLLTSYTQVEKLELQPIINIKVVEDEEPQLIRRPELTNALLARNWGELNFSEKMYFENDEPMFLKKKSMLKENSALHQKIQALHERAKIETSQDARLALVKEISDLDDTHFDNFQKIDNFAGEVIEPENKEVNTNNLVSERNRIRVRLSREKKKLEVAESKEMKLYHQNRIVEMKNSIDEIEKILNEKPV